MRRRTVMGGLALLPLAGKAASAAKAAGARLVGLRGEGLMACADLSEGAHDRDSFGVETNRHHLLRRG